MSARRHGLLAVAVALSLAGTALVAGAAPAATAAPPRPEVLTPKDGAALLAGRDTLQVKVRIAGRRQSQGQGSNGRKTFRALLDGRNVSGRFHRSGGFWRASLHPGGYGRGAHDLVVSVGRRHQRQVDTVHFVAMRRNERAMTISYRTSPRKRANSLLRVRTDKDIWNTSGYPKVFLNGHRVDERLQLDRDDRGFHGGFGPGAGLRFGRNRVEVEVLLRDGRYADASRTFWVPRDRPLAGAGPDRVTSVGTPVMLDGSSSRPAPASGGGDRASASAAAEEAPLSYSWKVLEAPSGKPAVLEEPESELPFFTPEVPGTYLVQLTVTPADGGPASFDYVTVTSPHSAGPMGEPIQTITGEGAIQVGEETYPRTGRGLKMLVLTATGLTKFAEATFVPQANGTWTNPQGTDILEALESAVGQTVILSGQGTQMGTGPLNSAQSKRLEEAIVKVGGTVSKEGQTPQGAADLNEGKWSVIGHLGLTEGHAEQNIGIPEAGIPAAQVPDFPKFPTDAGIPGSLNGYMQKIGTAAYQYISPEFLPIDTKWTPSLTEAPSNTSNTIVVGDRHIPSTSIVPGSIAVQLVVLSGASPNTLLENSSFAVLDAQCQTDYNGIAALNERLAFWANEANPGNNAPSGSNLVILQDFGRKTWPQPCWPGGNAPDWLQDKLPTVKSDGTNWVGSKFPTKRSELLSIWNGGNQHGHTVAGSIGKLAGTAAHDEAANYHRPFYDDETGQIVDRNFGGMTLVASTNLYQRGSAFFQGQGDDPRPSNYGQEPLLGNGRVTGVLRRNEQSQWELQAGASSAGWQSERGPLPLAQADLYELMFQKPEPWPCTPENPAPCPSGVPQQIEAAQRYFAALISPKAGAASLRDLYAEHYETPFSVTKASGPYPPQPTRFGYFSPAVFKALQSGNSAWTGLVGELEAVNQVGSGVKEWQSFLEKGSSRLVNVQTSGQNVINAVNDVYDKLIKENKEAEVDGAIAADVLYSLSDLVEIGLIASGNPEAYPVVAPSLGALASVIDIGDDSADLLTNDGASGGEGNVPNNTEAIRAKLSAVGYDIQERYANISAAMEHFGGILVDDPAKLREASANFDPGGPWDLNTESKVRMGQAMAASVQTATYESILPEAFVQWVVSPMHTNRNPGGSADLPYAIHYTCPDTNTNHGGDTRNPWKNSAETNWTMESVGWSGGGPTPGTAFTPQNSQSYTVRGLKSSLDDMHPDRPTTGPGEPGLQHSGTDAPPSLFKSIFGSYSPFGNATNPGPLGVDKEQIFGLEDWTMRKFQCGWTR